MRRSRHIAVLLGMLSVAGCVDQSATTPPPPEAPAELIGLDRDGVVKLLGDPADSRTEGAARVLTYRGKNNCQLDVIFFIDVKTGTERVLSFEQQPDSGKHAAACYPGLRGAK